LDTNDIADQLEEQLEQGFAMRDEQGRVVLRIGLLTTLYFDTGSMPVGREAVAQCIADYLAMCREQLRWALHPKGGGWRELSKNPVPTPAEWFAESRPAENDIWEFYYHGGDSADESSDFRVYGVGARKWQSELHGRLSFLSAALPLTWFADHAGSFPEFVLGWCRRLRPMHGYAGLGILDSPDAGVAEAHKQMTYGLARRFPGLEADYPISHVHYLKDGIKGVNWLTVLSTPWLERLGGLPTLQTELAEPFRLHEYDGGLVIQAGAMPQLGDSNRKLQIAEYRRLARVLRPIRVSDHASFPAWSGFDEERTTAWLARFDEP
jgi:hypothetical protein